MGGLVEWVLAFAIVRGLTTTAAYREDEGGLRGTGREALMSSTAPSAAGAAGANAGDTDVQSHVSSEQTESSTKGEEWVAACELKSGPTLFVDRASVRTMGPTRLFRWASRASSGAEPQASQYTALASCADKSIEAAWPGDARRTKEGSGGRCLVNVVCEIAPDPVSMNTGAYAPQ